MNSPDAQSPPNDSYQVVALRYRPQSFESLVGQGHIATALSNAINQNRVGHAYLFTGARGVGKTSSARIFAKCLNCENGPTTEPCNECDTCQAISVGEDVDVLEIDGASNRGIDEIRQLRSNVAVRPSRCRFKIYIIDEVHMLTQQAFNALLKTLEEPPGHVKFIFCTTDPQKIPITVLSRCQRFDFSPVKTDKISERLKEIAEAEGVVASEAALQLLARRANGSMRDSQSLLEQLFSFCGEEITEDEVHQLLGTTDTGRIAEIAAALVAKDTNSALALFDQNLRAGTNAGQLAGQLLGYFRDMMAVRVGCGEDTLLNCSGSDIPALKEYGDQLGLETILAVVQVLDSAIVRMQSSLHARTLLEVAIVRACGLEHVDSISGLIKSLSTAGNVTVATGGEGAPPKKKQPTEVSSSNQAPAAPSGPTASVAASSFNAPQIAPQSTPQIASPPATPAPSSSQPAAQQASSAAATATATTAAVAAASTAAVVAASVTAQPVPVQGNAQPPAPPAGTSPQESASSSTNPAEANPADVYREALGQLTDMTADMAGGFESVEMSDGKMVVTLLNAYSTTMCSKPDRKSKIEAAVEATTGKKIRIDFFTTTKPQVSSEPTKPKLSRVQQLRQLQEHPFVKEAIELFECEISDFYAR